MDRSLVAIALILLVRPLMAQTTDLACPTINIDSADPTYTINLNFSRSEDVAQIVVAWDKDQGAPPISLIEYPLKTAMQLIRTTYREMVAENSFPKTTYLRMFDLKNGLGALFCPSYQTEKNTTILLVSRSIFDSSNEATRVLAHEMFHAYVDRQRIALSDWLEEGLAHLIESIITNRFPGVPIAAHQKLPALPLADDYSKLNSAVERMSVNGHGFLFARYLFGKYGDTLIKDVLALAQTLSFKSDQDLLASILKPPKWDSFVGTFRDFEIAKWVNTIDYFSGYEDRFFIAPLPSPFERRGTMQIGIAPWMSYPLQSDKNLNQRPVDFMTEDWLIATIDESPIKVEKFHGITLANLPKGAFVLRIIFGSRAAERSSKSAPRLRLFP